MNRFSKWQISLLCGLLISVFLSFGSFSANCSDIRTKVLRLHVLANSDNEYDQNLKLKVRDRLLITGDGIFDEAINISDAETAVKENLHLLLAAAKDEITKNGYSYNVKIDLEKCYFETRYYENFTLPAGEYDAVRVLIGEAKGKNWWCVMFPAVCVPAAEKKGKLSDVLNESEMDVVENRNKYEFRIKSLEVFEDIKRWFSY